MFKPRNSSDQAVAEPIVHARAIGAASFIGIGLATVAGLLWTAAAFSSRESWAYSHLAWWLGGTVIAVSLLAGLASGTLSSTRGTAAGAANGATTAAIVTAVAGAFALVVLAVNGSFNQEVTVGGHAVIVSFVRPYVAFWAAAGSLGLGTIGGVAGGLLPRRRAGRPVVELAAVSEIPYLTRDGYKAPAASSL